MRTKPRVYFAGKIGRDDWRHSLSRDSRWGAVEDYGGEAWYQKNLFDPNLLYDEGRFFYGGPFFVSCDHGCAHGPNSHGVNLEGGACIEVPDGVAERRARIFEINRLRLLKASWVFAYIESPDCYGTLIELGMAHAAGIPISIGISPELAGAARDDLWMMEQTTKRPVIVGDPQACFDFCWAVQMQEPLRQHYRPTPVGALASSNGPLKRPPGGDGANPLFFGVLTEQHP